MSHPTRPLIGAHFSVAGGLENALHQAAALDCPAVQIFTKNARTWKESMPDSAQIDRFKQVREETRVEVVLSHCSYLINIAATDAAKREKAAQALVKEMERSALLGVDHVVLHPGSHLGAGMDKGIETAIATLNQVMAENPGDFPMLLLETTAGMGSGIGSRFEELAAILQGVNQKKNFGICLDTSHIFAAGYDIRTPETYAETVAEFDRIIGLPHLKAIHTNDSIPPLDSKKDRHAHIGQGCIGEMGFQCLMQDERLERVPKILETPKSDGDVDMDPVNLDKLRQLM